MRKDLNMRRGKQIAQGAHASMKVFLDKMTTHHSPSAGLHYGHVSPLGTDELEWIDGAFTKICVSVNSEAELIGIYESAKLAGLNCSLIQDAGHTEFNGVPTYTCCAIGPNEASKIDVITGGLQLL